MNIKSYVCLSVKTSQKRRKYQNIYDNLRRRYLILYFSEFTCFIWIKQHSSYIKYQSRYRMCVKQFKMCVCKHLLTIKFLWAILILPFYFAPISQRQDTLAKILFLMRALAFCIFSLSLFLWYFECHLFTSVNFIHFTLIYTSVLTFIYEDPFESG